MDDQMHDHNHRDIERALELFGEPTAPSTSDNMEGMEMEMGLDMGINMNMSMGMEMSGMDMGLDGIELGIGGQAQGRSGQRGHMIAGETDEQDAEEAEREVERFGEDQGGRQASGQNGISGNTGRTDDLDHAMILSLMRNPTTAPNPSNTANPIPTTQPPNFSIPTSLPALPVLSGSLVRPTTGRTTKQGAGQGRGSAQASGLGQGRGQPRGRGRTASIRPTAPLPASGRNVQAASSASSPPTSDLTPSAIELAIARTNTQHMPGNPSTQPSSTGFPHEEDQATLSRRAEEAAARMFRGIEADRLRDVEGSGAAGLPPDIPQGQVNVQATSSLSRGMTSQSSAPDGNASTAGGKRKRQSGSAETSNLQTAGPLSSKTGPPVKSTSKATRGGSAGTLKPRGRPILSHALPVSTTKPSTGLLQSQTDKIDYKAEAAQNRTGVSPGRPSEGETGINHPSGTQTPIDPTLEQGQSLADGMLADRFGDDPGAREGADQGQMDEGDLEKSTAYDGQLGSAEEEIQATEYTPTGRPKKVVSAEKKAQRAAKRAEQNRRAQQNFRLRREVHIKQLQDEIEQKDEWKKHRNEDRAVIHAQHIEIVALRKALIATARQGYRILDQENGIDFDPDLDPPSHAVPNLEDQQSLSGADAGTSTAGLAADLGLPLSDYISADSLTDEVALRQALQHLSENAISVARGRIAGQIATEAAADAQRKADEDAEDALALRGGSAEGEGMGMGIGQEDQVMLVG